MALEFEEILPYVEGEGDTGKTAREKINRNFTKIEPLANVGAEMQQLRQDVANDLEQLHDDVEEMVDKTTSLFGYYNCSTAGATAAKSVQAADYELTTGGNIRIKMEHTNTAASPVTLQIGNAAAKELYYNNEAVSDENTWEDNEVIVVYYDGTKYIATNSLGGKKDDDDLSQFFDVVEEQVGGSANLIDPSQYVDGFLNSSGGISSGNYRTTGKMEVESGATYTFFAPDSNNVIKAARMRWVSTWDSSDSFIETIDVSAQQYTAGSGVKYIRITPMYRYPDAEDRTCLIKGTELPDGEFPYYSEPEVVSHIELNGGNKPVEDKEDNELVTKKNLSDYVGEQMKGIPDISGLSAIVSAIKQKTDMLGIGEEQVGGSTNLLNPEEYGYGFYNSDGSYNSSQSYCTTGYIEVENGKTYTILAPDSNNVIKNGKIRWVYLYDSSDTFIERIEINTAQFTISNPNAVKVKITPTYNYLSQGVASSTGLFEGENPEWEAYSPSQSRTCLIYNPQVDLEGKGGKELVVKDDIPSGEGSGGGDDTPDTEGNFALSYSVGTGHAGADIITITDKDNNIITGTFDKNPDDYYGGSHVFNFMGFQQYGVTLGGNGADDVPPMHVMGQIIGGNHTISVKRVTAQSYTFDDTDIGGTITAPDYKKSDAVDAQVFTGEDFVIVRVVDAHTIWCLSKDTSAFSASWFKTDYSNVAQYKNQSILIASASADNLFPSVCSQVQKVMIDGKGVALHDNDKIDCRDHVDIIDSYNIVDFDYAKENLDIDDSGNMVYESPLFIRVNNTYRFMAKSKVLVIASATFAKSTYFNDVMFAQAAAMIPYHSSTFQQDIQTVRFYIPGSTTVSGVNYAEPHNFVYKNPDTYNMDSATWVDRTKPVTRIIQMTQAGLGFAMGYLPVGVGADLLHHTSTPFELRGNSGKIYPHGIDRAGLAVKDGNNIPANSSYTAVIYRIFFDADNQETGRICLYDVDYDGYKYVFVDYSHTIFDHVELDDSLNGHSIELVEQRNAVLTSPVYNGGFYVNATHVSGDSSYCVLKIKL